MIERKIGIEKVILKARAFNENNNSWHYHLLTPYCSLKKVPEYTIFLESAEGLYVSKIKNIRKAISTLRELDELLFEQLQK